MQIFKRNQRSLAGHVTESEIFHTRKTHLKQYSILQLIEILYRYFNTNDAYNFTSHVGILT